MGRLRITDVDIDTKNFIIDVAEVVARRINIEREWIKRGVVKRSKTE